MLVEFGKDQSFAKAIITRVIQTKFNNLTPEDKTGHEAYDSDQEMYTTYSAYYGTEVGPETDLKIIYFEVQ